MSIELPKAAGVGPDGLYYHDGSLVMVQPRAGQVVRLDLDASESVVTNVEVLASGHADFAYPTTGVLVGDSLYFIASSYADVPPRGSPAHGAVYIHAVAVR